MRRSKTRGRLGDHLVVCDRSGFTVWASDAQTEWNGALVRKGVWEARHPQEFVRGVKNNLAVNPSRPPPVDAYIGPLNTEITTAAAAGDRAIEVLHTDRFLLGDRIGIMLDNNELFRVIVLSVTDATNLRLLEPLPWSAAVGNVIFNFTAVSPPTLT